MVIRTRFAAFAGLFLVAFAPPPPPPPFAMLAPREHDGKPMPLFTIAEPRIGQRLNGPLFQRVKTALAAANVGNGADLRRFLAPNPDLKIESFTNGKLQQSAFTLEMIRAAGASCLGPFSFDERASWVQLSWVCRADQPTPLSKFFTFRHSAELSLTVWVEKGLITRIDAIEPLQVPGRRFVPMDAYQTMQAGH